MTKEAMRARLEKLHPQIAQRLADVIDGTKQVTCPDCSTKFEAQVPTSLTLKASQLILDRTGFGPTQKLEAVKPIDTDAFEALIAEVRIWPQDMQRRLVEEGCPKLYAELVRSASRLALSAGEPPADDSTSR